MTSRKKLIRRQLPANRFWRLLLNLGGGVSAWAIAAFVLGALALGVVSNLIFSLTFDPSSYTWVGAVRVLGLGAGLVALAYLLYHFDPNDRKLQIVATFDENRGIEPHPGLILLLSPGRTDLALFTLHHHAAGSETRRLRHCWVVTTPGAKAAFDELQAQVERADLALELHAVPIREATIEASYRAVRAVHASLAQLCGVQPDDVVSDLTGGLKTMTAGMVLACLPHGYALEYVESDRDEAGQIIEGSRRVVRVEMAFALRAGAAS